jgi:hypothetical protein
MQALNEILFDLEISWCGNKEVCSLAVEDSFFVSIDIVDDG